MQEEGGRQVRVTLDEINDEATNAARASLAEFLNILGTYAPADFMHTVVYESTSYNWVLDKIRTTFRLKTKGLGFLAAGTIITFNDAVAGLHSPYLISKSIAHEVLAD